VAHLLVLTALGVGSSATSRFGRYLAVQLRGRMPRDAMLGELLYRSSYRPLGATPWDLLLAPAGSHLITRVAPDRGPDEWRVHRRLPPGRTEYRSCCSRAGRQGDSPRHVRTNGLSVGHDLRRR
jgi:hypothetical protein